MKRIFTVYGVTLASLVGLMTTVPSHAAQIERIKQEYTNNSGIEVPPPYSGKKSDMTAIFVNEPYFKEVKFFQLEEPMSLSERVDRLLFGIKTDVPPEYDHYGYEMRRYMAGVGNAEKLGDPEYLIQQIGNVKKSLIILDYWEKALKEEIDAIEKVIEEKNETSSIRTTFRYNRGVVNAFLVESRNWLENNLKALEYLDEAGPKSYRFDSKDNSMYFKNSQNFREFSNIYTAKIKSLREVREYLPFRMMIY